MAKEKNVIDLFTPIYRVGDKQMVITHDWNHSAFRNGMQDRFKGLPFDVDKYGSNIQLAAYYERGRMYAALCLNDNCEPDEQHYMNARLKRLIL